MLTYTLDFIPNSILDKSELINNEAWRLIVIQKNKTLEAIIRLCFLNIMISLCLCVCVTVALSHYQNLYEKEARNCASVRVCWTFWLYKRNWQVPTCRLIDSQTRSFWSSCKNASPIFWVSSIILRLFYWVNVAKQNNNARHLRFLNEIWP